ncbi:MAG: VCBS repeat-containing protein, partial [Flavobacteriales bacterium]|nr:VCBS repeat-containing protein [Flavobacteriales bacterium]
MNKFYLSALGLLLSFAGFSQSFTNSNTMLDDNYNSGGCLGVVDMDNDGFDDIVLLDNSNQLKILYQTANGFNEMEYGQVSGATQWGMELGDCNNEGHADLFCGGSNDGV